MVVPVLARPLVKVVAYTVDCRGICFRRIEWLAKHDAWPGLVGNSLFWTTGKQNSNIIQSGCLKQATTIEMFRQGRASHLP